MFSGVNSSIIVSHCIVIRDWWVDTKSTNRPHFSISTDILNFCQPEGNRYEGISHVPKYGSASPDDAKRLYATTTTVNAAF